MELTLSTHLLVNSSLEEAAAALGGCGFGALEVWLAEPHVPWRNTAALDGLRRRLQDWGLRARSAHLPFYPSVPELRLRGRKWSLIHADTAERAAALDAAREGLRAAAALGAASAVLHLGWQHDRWTEREHAWARASVAALLPAARDCGVALALENIVSEGTTVGSLRALLDDVDPAGEAGICFDVGHAHMEGDAPGALEEALPRLRHLHIHDNDGTDDQHRAPGSGTVPWEPVLAFLARHGYQGLGAVEVRDLSAGAEPAARVLEREAASVRAFREQWTRRGLLRPCPSERPSPTAPPGDCSAARCRSGS